jgi:hypothetical protein
MKNDMNKLQTFLLAAAALLVVVLISVVAVQIGGVSIRSTSRTHIIGSLTTATRTLVPGVPVVVRAEGVEPQPSAAMILLMRLPEANVAVRQIESQELQRGSFSINVPCDSSVAAEEPIPTRLILIDRVSQAVLAQSNQLSLLPPGPDCVR